MTFIHTESMYDLIGYQALKGYKNRNSKRLLLTPYLTVFMFGISKLLYLLFDTSRLAIRFFINARFRLFNVLKVSRAEVSSVLTSTVHLSHFFTKVL